MRAVPYRVKTFRLMLDPWLIPLAILAVLAEAYLVYRVSGFVGVEIIGVIIGVVAFHFDFSPAEPARPAELAEHSPDLRVAKRNTQIVKLVSCGLIVTSFIGLIAQSRFVV